MHFDFDQAIKHIQNLFPEPWPGGVIIEAVVEKEKSGKGPRHIKFSHLLQGPQDFERIPEQHIRGLLFQDCNFYFSCGFVDGRKDGKHGYFKRTKENIVGISFLWADVDDIDLEQAEAIEGACPCPPTGYVRSGGGYHFYWLLHGVIDAADPRIIEALKRLEAWTGGDRIAKTSQILGLPGSVKFKPWKYDEPRAIYVQKWTHKLRYDIDDILKHRITAKELRLPFDFVTAHIVNGTPFSDGDRSTRDYAIMKELIKAKHSREEILAVFQNDLFACSEKILEHNGEGYFNYTYTKALSEVKTTGDGIGVTDNGKVVILKKVDGKGNVSEDIISNFAIVPQELHVYEDDTFGLIVTVICGDMRRKINVNARVLASSISFRSIAGIPGLAWMGTEKEFQQYIGYVRTQITEDKKFPATMICGWFKNKVVTTDYQLGKKGVEVRYWNKGSSPKVILSKEDLNFHEFMQEVYEHLRVLNTSRVAFHSFGWFAAALLAPQIRTALNRQFPILCLSGEPGSGKTTTAITLNKALCGVVSDYTYQGSHAALRRVFSSTNCFPIFMDEYEASSRSTEIDAYLRYAWQMGTVPRCSHSNWDAIDDLPLVAPICIGTITSITDEALRDRMLYIRVRTSDRPKDPKGINFFRMVPPGYFARNWFREDKKDIVKQIKHCIAAYELQYPDSTDRQAIAEGVSLGVLQYCNKKYWNNKWDWKTANNAEMEEIISTQKETPESMIDAIMAFMLRNPGISNIFPDKDWRYDIETYPGKEVMYLHQSQFRDKAPHVAKMLQFPPYIGKKWLTERFQDMLHQGKVIRTSAVKRLNGAGVSCLWLDLAYLPATKEAVGEILQDRGVLSFKP